jgi:DNA-binding CsgD family transcriptional regulator
MGNEPADSVAAVATLALDRGDQNRGAGPLFFHALCSLIWSEEFTLARPLLERALAKARSGGSTPELLVSLFALSLLELRQGRLQAVEELGQMALEIGALDPAHLNMRGVIANVIEARIERGDHGGAAALVTDAGPLDDTLQSNLFLHARARATLTAGDAAAALEDLEILARRLARAPSDAPGVCDWRSTAALAQLSVGEHAAARVLLNEQLALARTAGAPRVLGMALYAAAQADAHGPQREALLRESVATLERGDAPLALAHGLFHLGSELRHQRRAVEARAPLARCAELATLCGAEPLHARAVEEQAATGERRRRGHAATLQELTPSERRTALLAAEGLTNREIAQRHYITVKTVETQLRSAFRKLDITSRKQLSAALRTAE